MAINLKFLRVGDTMVFADGTKGVCTVVYPNGGYFIRWAVYDESGKPRGWSESDGYCCVTMFPANGRLGYTNSVTGQYVESPGDIVDIIKPNVEILQDEITELKTRIKELKWAESIRKAESEPNPNHDPATA